MKGERGLLKKAWRKLFIPPLRGGHGGTRSARESKRDNPRFCGLLNFVSNAQARKENAISALFRARGARVNPSERIFAIKTFYGDDLYRLPCVKGTVREVDKKSVFPQQDAYPSREKPPISPLCAKMRLEGSL